MTAAGDVPGRAAAVQRAVTWLCRLGLRIFFRRIEIVGEANVPASGPVVLVLNHPNGLMDPLFVLALAPRRVAFLAKAPLFEMPVIGRLVRAFESLPVYRASDGADPRRNRTTLQAAGDLLGRGGAIALFPEGMSHDAPALQPLKTGAARIALGAQALLATDGGETAGVRIVPAGLHYSAKGTFRSGAVLVYGDSIEVGPAALDEGGEPPHEAVRELTARMDAALRALTVNAGDEELIGLAATAARMLASRAAPDGYAGPVHRRYDLMRQILERHRALSASAPAEVGALVERLRRYRDMEAEFGLDDAASGDVRFGVAAWFVIRTLTVLGLSLPFVGVGLVENSIPYRVVGPWARRVAGGTEAVLSTTKVLAGMILFPVAWLVVSAAVGIMFGWGWAAVHLVLAPVCARAALWFLDRAEVIAAGARALWSRWAQPEAHARLVAEREALAEALMRAAER